MAAVMDRVIRDGEGTCERDWLTWPGLARLPAITLEALVPAGRRAVVVAPHPDDEVLAVGGLLSMLARGGRQTLVVAVTDGGESHRGSMQWPRERLLRVRPIESRRALQRLGLPGDTLRLALPDGGLSNQGDTLTGYLQAIVAPTDVVFTTWRMDGHPDHEATGHAAAVASARVGAQFIEVPVWAWHWARPGDARMPWRQARRLALDTPAVRQKTAALQAFDSQLRFDPSTGREAVLRGSTIERAARPFEVFFL